MIDSSRSSRLRNAALVAASVVLVGCAKSDAAASDSQVPPVVGARTAVVTRRAVRETIDGIGTITTRPDHMAQMSAPAVTRVTRVFVTVGQPVRAGTQLVSFDRAPLDAQAAAAATALAAAQRSLERAKRLVEAGIAPRKDLDQAASDLARATADAISAQRMQAMATLRAPINGVVTTMNAVLGATVDPAQTLLAVADLTALDLLMPVPPDAAARVHRGLSVDMTAHASGDTEALGTATVADVGGTIDSTARAVVVRAPITHPARQLRIGETVFARIVLAANPNALTVPNEALVPEGEGLKVFVVDAQHIAHSTPVETGVRDGGFTEITKGLSGGETVVTYGAYGVADSAKVTSTAETPAATAIPVATPKP
ncbi:MAG: efflux transporter, family, subunit [Gemmatimonadetes bacterium]|jgi:membrane fusion protein (multidrug efflux system)|nr:efflux transporter, family, subunit [Gemmatimonadota bacterium]